MKVNLPLESMTVAQKLTAMELLWADLSAHAPDQVSPAWHFDILAERERRVARGEEKILDWSEAKRLLREELNDSSNS